METYIAKSQFHNNEIYLNLEEAKKFKSKYGDIITVFKNTDHNIKELDKLACDYSDCKCGGYHFDFNWCIED